MGGMSIVEVYQYSNGDDGEYVTLSGTIGQIAYDVTIEDGIAGTKITVVANGRRTIVSVP